MSTVKKTIKELPRIERPREKLIKYGSLKLTNSELLAIILGSGTQGKNVIALSTKILKRFGAQKLPSLKFNQLQKCLGLGPAKACGIIACFELGRRLLKSKKIQIYLEAKDVWHELKDIRNLKKEYFVVFYLDNQRQEIKREIISMGTITAGLVHPREIFEPAVRNLAAQIIIAHNHPYGDIQPSTDDLLITKRLVSAGKILGIEVVDHVVVTKTKFFSLKEKGLL
jgi:DNA repair protein RadC